MREFNYPKPSQKVAAVFVNIFNILALMISITGIIIAVYAKIQLGYETWMMVTGIVASIIIPGAVIANTPKLARVAARRDRQRANTKYHYAFIDRYNAHPLSGYLEVNEIDDFSLGGGLVIRGIPTVDEDGVTPVLIQIDDLTPKKEEKRENPNEKYYKHY